MSHPRSTRDERFRGRERLVEDLLYPWEFGGSKFIDEKLVAMRSNLTWTLEDWIIDDL